MNIFKGIQATINRSIKNNILSVSEIIYQIP